MPTTQDPQATTAQASVQSTTQLVPLSVQEKSYVEQSFQDAKDFRSIGERITAPLEEIISKTTEIIEKDPIMDVSEELGSMNKKMQGVYSDIVDNDGMVMKFFKQLPGIGVIANIIDQKFDEFAFDIKSVNNKISTIFSGFDQSYTSLNISIDMQRDFLEGIEKNLGKVVAYKEFLEEKITKFKKELDTSNEADKEKISLFLRSVEFFLTNLVVLIGNLEMARKRLLIRLDSAQKLSLSMNSSRPIFQALLSTAIIEISGQKALDASAKAMTSMGEMIDKMSVDLTDKVIESNKKAEEISAKPILSSSVFVENVSKLSNHFKEMEGYRKQIAEEAAQEKEEFENARKSLKNIQILNQKEAKELEAMLTV